MSAGPEEQVAKAEGHEPGVSAGPGSGSARPHLRILVVAPRAWYLQLMDGMNAHILSLLEADGRFKVVDVLGPDNEVFGALSTKDHDAVLVHFNPKTLGRTGLFRRLADPATPSPFLPHAVVAMQIEDAQETLGSPEKDAIWRRYKHLCISYYDTDPIKEKYKDLTLHLIPHHRDRTVFHPGHPDPVPIQDRPIDILIYGDMWPPAYPFRLRVKNLLLKEGPARGWHIQYVNFPGWTLQGRSRDQLIQGTRLADLLRRSKMALTTDSVLHYMVAKYVEIPLCGAVMLGTLPPMAHKFYSPHEHIALIDRSMSDEQILQVIQSHLADQPKLQKMADGARHVAEQHFDLRSYPDKLYQIFAEAHAQAGLA